MGCRCLILTHFYCSDFSHPQDLLESFWSCPSARSFCISDSPSAAVDGPICWWKFTFCPRLTLALVRPVSHLDTVDLYLRAAALIIKKVLCSSRTLILSECLSSVQKLVDKESVQNSALIPALYQIKKLRMFWIIKGTLQIACSLVLLSYLIIHSFTHFHPGSWGPTLGTHTYRNTLSVSL